MPETFRIRDLPADERPRERLARAGASALSSEELLALLIGSGARGESALDCARRVLAGFTTEVRLDRIEALYRGLVVGSSLSKRPQHRG